MMWAGDLATGCRRAGMSARRHLGSLPGRYGRYKWPTLSELHVKLFGKDFEGAHGARADVGACAACYFGMKVKRAV